MAIWWRGKSKKEINEKKAIRDEAFSYFEKAVNLDDKMGAIAYVFWGNELLDGVNPDDAIEKYRSATELDPNYPIAYNNWGISLFYQYNVDGAISKYDEAISKNLDYHPDASYNKGVALLSLNDGNKLEEANELFKTAFTQNPAFANAAYLYGFTQYRLGHPGDAIKYFERAVKLKINKSARFYDNWGNALIYTASTFSQVQNRWQEIDYPKVMDAIDKYKQAIKKDSEDYLAYYDCGVALQSLGNCHAAIELYQKADYLYKSLGRKHPFDLPKTAILTAQQLEIKNNCTPTQRVPNAIKIAAAAETCLPPMVTGNSTLDPKQATLETKPDSQ
jgi:superkiller protein 3